MASAGMSSHGRFGHPNGDTDDETALQSDEASEEDRIQQYKTDNLDNDLTGSATHTTTTTATNTNSTITNTKNFSSSKLMMTGDNNEVLISGSTQAAADKIQQRTSNNAVQDTKGIDNDKPNITNNDEEWHKNEMIKQKQQQTKAQNDTNNNTNDEVQVANQNNNNNAPNKNQMTKQQRRYSNTSGTTSLDGQQRVGSDICSGPTTSKFREKRPEPLKLSSNLNQEIPLDLSVRSASNVPTDASGSVFGLLCSNQLTTLETPRILWQDNELLMESGAPNITSSTSMALSPLASSGMPIESASKLRLFSSTSSSASMTMIPKRKICGDRNNNNSIPTGVSGVLNTPIALPLTPSTPLTPDSVAAATAAAHFAAANRLASITGNGVDRYIPLALATNLPISPARTHHLARNFVSSTETSGGWSQPPRRSCSTENLSSLLTSAAAKFSSKTPKTMTNNSKSSHQQSAAATQRLLDALRYQQQRTSNDLLSAGMDHNGTKRISPLATNSLTAAQKQQDKATNVVASNNMFDTAEGSRSHSSASTSSGSRFSYSSQQIAAARLAQRMQQSQQHSHHSPTMASCWSKGASMNSPGTMAGVDNHNSNNSSSHNVSPLTPTNVANATANLLNIRLNSPNSSSNNSTSYMDSLGNSTNNESQQQQQKPRSFSSISDFLAASTAVAAVAANIAQSSSKESSQHLQQQQYCPMASTAVAITTAAITGTTTAADPLMSVTYCQSSLGPTSAANVDANANMSGSSTTTTSASAATATVTRLTQQQSTNNISANQLSGCASGGSNSTTLNTPTLISPNQLNAGHLCFLPSPTLSPMSSVFELPSPLLMFPPTTSVSNSNTNTINNNTTTTSNSASRDDATKNNNTHVPSTAACSSLKGLVSNSKAPSSVAPNSKEQIDCGSASGQPTAVNIASSLDHFASITQPIMSAATVASNSASLTSTAQETSTNHVCPSGSSLDNTAAGNDRDKRVRYNAQPSGDRFAQLITSGEQKLATNVVGPAAAPAALEHTSVPKDTQQQQQHVQADVATRMEVDADDVNVDDEDGDDGEDDEDGGDDIDANALTDLDDSTDDEGDDSDECGGADAKFGAREGHLGRQSSNRCRRRRGKGAASSPWARARRFKQTITMKGLVCQHPQQPSMPRPATAVPRILVSESNRPQQQIQQQQNVCDRAERAALINASSLNTGLNRIEAQQQHQQQQQQVRQQRDMVDKRALSPKSFRARINLYHNKRHESSSAPPEVIGVECGSCVASGSGSTYGRQTPKAKLKTLSTMESNNACSSGNVCVLDCNDTVSHRLARDQQSGFNGTSPDNRPQQQQQSAWVSNGLPSRMLQQSSSSSSSLQHSSLPASNSVDNITTGARCSASWNSSIACYQQQQALPPDAGDQFYGGDSVASCSKPLAASSVPTATGATLTATDSPAGTTGLAITGKGSGTIESGNASAAAAAMGIPGCCAAALASAGSDGAAARAHLAACWVSASLEGLRQHLYCDSLATAAQQQQTQIQRSATTQWDTPNNNPSMPSATAGPSLMASNSATFATSSENAPPNGRAPISGGTSAVSAAGQSISVGDNLNRCGSITSSSIGCEHSSSTTVADNCLASSSAAVATSNLSTQMPQHWFHGGGSGDMRMRQQHQVMGPMIGRFEHSITKLNTGNNVASSTLQVHNTIEPYSATSRSMGELTIGAKINTVNQSTADCSSFLHGDVQQQHHQQQLLVDRSMYLHYSSPSYEHRSNHSSGGNCSPASTSGNGINCRSPPPLHSSSRRGSSALGSRTVSATPTKMMLGGASSMASAAFSTGSDTALANGPASSHDAITAAMVNGSSITIHSRPDSVASVNSSISLDLDSFKNVGLSSGGGGERNPPSSLSSTPNHHHHRQQHHHAGIFSHHHHQQYSSLSRPSSAASNNTQLSGSSGCITIRRHRHCTTPQIRTASSASSCGSSSGAPKKYHCDQCSKSFTRSDMLTRHRRLHSGDRPFQCNDCKQEFSRSDHLSTHMRTHTGEKPYKCKLCCYSACRKDMITRHMKVHNRSVQAQIQQATSRLATPTIATTPAQNSSSYQSLQLLYNQQQQSHLHHQQQQPQQRTN